VLESQGFKFSSFTIDGRRGIIQWLEKHYSHVPIQLCQFHQIKTIRNYTTRNPKTDCGKALYSLIKQLTQLSPSKFVDQFNSLQVKYHDFLKERNEQRQFMHRRLCNAISSLKTNLPYLFTYKLYPELAIPNTTNSCDGSFAQWKQKVKIHRGLRLCRREKMIHFLLSKS
jgi:hypothetical protein